MNVILIAVFVSVLFIPIPSLYAQQQQVLCEEAKRIALAYGNVVARARNRAEAELAQVLAELTSLRGKYDKLIKSKSKPEESESPSVGSEIIGSDEQEEKTQSVDVPN